MPSSRTIVLFDVDGTLTAPRRPATPEMLDILEKLRRKVKVGVVSGSNEAKLLEQLGAQSGALTFPRDHANSATPNAASPAHLQAMDSLSHYVDYFFPENGTTAYHHTKKIGDSVSIREHLGEDKLKRFVNYTLRYLAEIEDVPFKRGTFIEYRNGLINVSPVGRNCSYDERALFESFDKTARVRARMIEALTREFSESLKMTFAIGGQISIDCYPEGWDKRYCLRHLPASDFDYIHFFGDKSYPGGNDYELLQDPRIIGHPVTGPAHTAALIKELFLTEGKVFA